MKNNRLGRTSADAVLLTIIKLVTTVLGLVTTRLLSEYLAVYDYGTYSQIMLIVSTVSSLTIFGMMDGTNYFYCSETDTEKREAYTATIFTLQCIIGAVSGCVVLLLSMPLCAYFNNPDLKGLLIFAAALPLLQNLMGICQILVVSVGKARVLAVRNFIVSLIRLAVVSVVALFVRNIIVVLTASVILDIGQIIFFAFILKKSNCHIRFTKADMHLVKTILLYCAPMAIFTTVNSLNRDMDKYLVSLMTDTETLALYANASRQLPFDIIMSSFCTVLIPYITKYISEKKKEKAAQLYKLFLEITYISTGVLCCAALAAAPQLMKLLYSNKYTSGIAIFCVYIFVDLFRFTNISLILSAAGKTKRLMLIGFGALGLNAVLNIVLYNSIGLIGPAAATLATTVIIGILMLYFSARELESRITNFFDFSYVCKFFAESVILTLVLGIFQQYLEKADVHYFVILIVIAGIYGAVMALLNGKRLFGNMKEVSSISREE